MSPSHRCTLTVCLGLALAATGCRHGLSTGEVIARSPAGIRVEVEFAAPDLVPGARADQAGRLFGEVLLFDDDGLLLNVDRSVSTLTTERIVRVSNALLLRVWRAWAGSDRPIGSERGRSVDLVDDEDRSWLRSLARFPYGLDAGVERALLDAYGQEAVLELGVGAGGEAVDRVAFLELARGAAQRFRDRRVAIANGYRKLGPDFPGMGEHWVHTGLIASREVEPERPPVLAYADLDGTPTLLGVAFAVPLGPDDEPPVTPLGAQVWHDHSGSLDEETLILDSPESHHDPGAATQRGTRLSMVHAWFWLENPDGELAQNNWALPFARLGLETPIRPSQGAARALSLLGSGTTYYESLLVRAGRADPPSIRVIESALARAVAAAERCVAGSERSLSPVQVETLEGVWQGLWAELEGSLPGEVWSRLDSAARVWRGET